MVVTVWIIFCMDLGQGDDGSKKEEQRFHFGLSLCGFANKFDQLWSFPPFYNPAVRLGLHLNWQKREQRSLYVTALSASYACSVRVSQLISIYSGGCLPTVRTFSHINKLKPIFLFLALQNLIRLFCSKEVVFDNFFFQYYHILVSLRRRVVTSHVRRLGYVL